MMLRDDEVPTALLCVALLAFACLTPAQNDTFWHLRSGQLLYETRAFITTEPFSHTAFGAPLQNHWWLSQLTFYAVFLLGGPTLLTAFAGGLALLAVVGSWRLTRGPFELRLALLVFLVLGTAPEWAIRPQVLSLALLVLSAHLITRDRIRWLPLVCLVWGNAHAMVIFGLVMAGACVLEALIWTRRRLLHDALIAAACAVAPMVSPVGLAYWPRVFETVTVSRALGLQEYRAPLDAAALPFWIAVAVLLWLVWRRRSTLAQVTRDSRILLVASLVLAVAAMTASRNVAFFAVVAAPVISRLWPWTTRVAGKARPAGAAAYVLVVGAAAAAMVVVTARWRDDGIRLGWHPMSRELIAAVRSCPDPMFNHLEDGGFLMWSIPGKPVFVDSRMEAYPLALLRRSRAADLDGEYRQLFAAYGIRCAVVKKETRLARSLSADATFRVGYSDMAYAVFVRR